MQRQLEFWNDDEKETSKRTHLEVKNAQAETKREAKGLFTNPDRQCDFDGDPHEKWPQPANTRNSIFVDRIRNDIDGPAHRFEIRRHDFVEVFVDKDNLRYGHIVGISQKKQEVRVAFDDANEEIWFDIACIFPAINETERKQKPRSLDWKHVSENGDSICLQQEIAKRISRQTDYTSLKIVSVVRVGSMKGRPKLTSTSEAQAFFKKYWKDNPSPDQEKFAIATLDTKHAVQSVVVITQGTLDASLVHPREVFKPAIIEGASAICLSHNHPSGDPTPSREDHEVTRRLTEIGTLIGITVLDHIVVGDGTLESVSIREC
ncbi:JAB domain-containing protein [Rhodopirellula sallentina]|uniref:DNA repair protein RadC n=1 Tax=Rhodopirellula sallentina SM41 TaxID=1263870 RepID=M5U0V7_9BACT|nr:JAB domain-containing protein [Rhodopirellula sallentina]EMI55080.1 DNA repair protein RadC [Rhodopirellula sallentina SM41]